MNCNEEYILALLSTLISFDTSNEPGNEDPLARCIGNELNEMGFQTKIVSCGTNRSSVIATLGNPDGVKLVLNGHLDVVPVSSNWTRPPFQLSREGDCLFGRGTADMKGGIASMIAAAKQLIEEGMDFSKGQLILAFVADEELYNKGAHSILSLPEIRNADCAIIGEPTNLNICIGHRGTARSIIKIKGIPCHSSKPEEGVNAISHMSRVIQAIDLHNESLRAISHPILPNPSIAVVMIEGGEKDNIIPGHCDIRFDRRTLPSDTEKSVHNEIVELLENVKEGHRNFEYEIKPYIFLGAGEVSKDSVIVEKSIEAYHEIFKKPAELVDFTATCEQSLFMNAGIDSLIFGPGNIQQAHVDDEYIHISQLNLASEFYYTVVRKLLS